jgi:glutathione peroxidase
MPSHGTIPYRRGRQDEAGSLALAAAAVVAFTLLTLVLATAGARAGDATTTGGPTARAPLPDRTAAAASASAFAYAYDDDYSTPARSTPPASTLGANLRAGDTSSLYQFTLPDIDGKPVSLESYRGKVLLLVNTASKCGFTPQYEGLEKLSKTYRDRGLVVLGFPANNFRQQEPGTNAEIKSFCSTKYGVDFPMFGKISVKGDDIHPLYRWLTSKDTDPAFAGDIQWNFTKFLVDREGKVVARFASGVTPDSPQLTAAVEKTLGGALTAR